MYNSAAKKAEIQFIVWDLGEFGFEPSVLHKSKHLLIVSNIKLIFSLICKARTRSVPALSYTQMSSCHVGFRNRLVFIHPFLQWLLRRVRWHHSASQYMLPVMIQRWRRCYMMALHSTIYSRHCKKNKKNKQKQLVFIHQVSACKFQQAAQTYRNL